MRLSLAFALLLAATTLFAVPTITSISPTEGPVTGGTAVTIKGFGFSATGPYKLGFAGAGGFVAATEIKVVDGNTITALTPAYLPGKTLVGFSQPDGSASLADAFVFTGNATDAFDRLLIPLFLWPIYGAYGSQFETTLSLWNASLEEMTVNGLLSACYGLGTCVPTLHAPLPPRPIAITSDFELTGTATAPGKFIYVAKGSGRYLAAELRVQDVSRQSQTWGTEIPVVPDTQMRTSIVALLDIPNDERFRSTLRVYGDQEGTVQVRIVRTQPAAAVVSEFLLPLTPGRTIYEPSYASFSAFPAPPPTASPLIAKLRVEIEPVTYGLHTWSFVSVTNNETQHITVITQR